DMDRGESSDPEDVAPFVDSPARPYNRDRVQQLAGSGKISQAAADEFAPPAPLSASPRFQGAFLDGELIINTSNLPSRFQRSAPSGSDRQGTGAMRGNMDDSSGRMRTNSGANIEIVPGAAQYQARSPGQISLQSLS